MVIGVKIIDNMVIGVDNVGCWGKGNVVIGVKIIDECGNWGKGNVVIGVKIIDNVVIGVDNVGVRGMSNRAKN